MKNVLLYYGVQDRPKDEPLLVQVDDLAELHVIHAQSIGGIDIRYTYVVQTELTAPEPSEDGDDPGTA